MGRPPLSLTDCEVAIVGLGLMGGSLAMALRGQCRTLIGVDRDPAVAQEALARGVVDQVTVFEAAHNTDVLVLASPVRAIVSQVNQLAASAFYPPRATVVIDLGSTKAQVMQAILDHEPRILPESLTVEVMVNDIQLDHHNQIGLRISGHLWAQPVPLELLLHTDVDLETGRVDVREMK